MTLRYLHEYTLHHIDGRVSPVYGYMLFAEITNRKDILFINNFRIWVRKDKVKQQIQFIKRT